MAPTHLLLTYDFPPIGGGIARWMAELAKRYPAGSLIVSTGQNGDSSDVDAGFPNRVDRLAIQARRLRTIQGLLLWSRRVAVLARSTHAEFIWCGNIKPAAYPARWTMTRTGTPLGNLVHGAGLAHVASMEGEVAADNAMGHAATMDYTVIPNPIYTFPEVAFVGLTEAQAKERYPEARVERFPWVAIGKAVAIGDTEGFVKVITGKYGEILGAHIIGPDATNLISEYSVAMRGELTTDEIIETIHPHPTLSEGLREAILTVEGRPVHIGPKKQLARTR